MAQQETHQTAAQLHRVESAAARSNVPVRRSPSGAACQASHTIAGELQHVPHTGTAVYEGRAGWGSACRFWQAHLKAYFEQQVPRPMGE